MLKSIISKRRIIQAAVGGLMLISIVFFKESLLYVLVIGAAVGIIFGKVFCRWMCPMGFIMELTMGKGSDEKRQLYNYHKLGCPIAWVSGFLNRFSIFRIKRDTAKCTNCGRCDKNCYISTLNKDYSLFRENKKNPAVDFSCSKCLACVQNCPTKSLQYKV